MKVGVFAGTHEDTRMGVELLRERGFETLSYPISKNPKDQSLLQYYSREELTRLVEEKNCGCKKVWCRENFYLLQFTFSINRSRGLISPPGHPNYHSLGFLQRP